MSFKKTGRTTTLGVVDNKDKERQAQTQQDSDKKKSTPKSSSNN